MAHRQREQASRAPRKPERRSSALNRTIEALRAENQRLIEEDARLKSERM